MSKNISTLLAIGLLAASTVGEAKLHPSLDCRIQASDLSINGKPLTYEAVAVARGAKVASNGTAYAPVTMPNGRVVIYAIDRSGCARKTDLRYWR